MASKPVLTLIQQTCVKILLLTAFIQCLTVNELTYRGDMRSVTRFVKNYFPRESSLCVVLTGICEGSCLPEFPLPVVLLTADKILRDCNNKLSEHDGYVFITSASADRSLESHTLPLLQCFSQTTLTLKTKYILVIHYSELVFANETSMYVTYFHRIWKIFEIANIAVLSVPKQMQSNSEPSVFSYNPFLARVKSRFAALARNDLTLDIRSEMKNRFRNMHGHTLKGSFDQFQGITYEDFREKKTLGAYPPILFKYILESYLGVTIEAYSESKNNQHGLSGNSIFNMKSGKPNTDELIGGISDLRIAPRPITTIRNPEKIENIHIGIESQYVFIVPKPKDVESWRLFQYIFQWEVSVAFGLTLLTLCGFAALFIYLHPASRSQSATSEVVSVWKAVLSVSINKLPRSHTQRLLIAVALLLGLIIVTVACAQLFALIKTKPREPSITTLHDLQDSNLPIQCILQLCGLAMDTFQNSSLSKLRSHLKADKMKKVEDMFDPRFLNITDHAVLYSLGLLNIILSLPESREFLQYFEIVGEPALTSAIVLNFPKGSLYNDRLVELNLRLTAGGLHKKQYEVSAKSNTKKSAASFKPTGSASEPRSSDDTNTPLKYKDLEMPFFILYIGLTASFMCFLIEILSYPFVSI